MNSAQIINVATAFRNFKYWYGGSGEIATRALADSLRDAYPSIWTDTYYQTALLDINGRNRVADCSWLVSASYQLGYHCSTAEMHNVFLSYADEIQNGMITWRTGHCGIYYNDTVIQMANQAEDFQIRPYNASDWEDTLYDPNVDYDDPTPPAPVPGSHLPIWMLFKFGGI